MVKGYVAKNLKTSNGEPFDMRNSHFFEKITAKVGTCDLKID